MLTISRPELLERILELEVVTSDKPRRQALACVARHHLYNYGQDILAALDARHIEQMTARELKSYKRSLERIKPSSGMKTSTALAKLIGLPAYMNEKKGKPEPAKHLLDFLKNAGPAYFDIILIFFRDHVITPKYRAEAPFFVRAAIHEAFDDPAFVHELEAMQDSVRCSPQAIIAGIEETRASAQQKLQSFGGFWNVLRFSHHGQRVVRLAMEVICPPSGRPLFKLHYRTRGMTHQKIKATFVTRGSLMALKGEQHVMFLGQEQTLQGQPIDGYPVMITCPANILPDAPHIGLVQRRHADGSVFAIKAQFIPAKQQSIEQLLEENRIGSFQGDEAIAAMSSDIVGFQDLMADLERAATDARGGLMV